HPKVDYGIKLPILLEMPLRCNLSCTRYERIDVTEKITEYNFEGGKVYAYKATPEYVHDSKKTKGITVIPQDYLDLVTKACDSIGFDFRQEYDATTSTSNLELAAPVVWKKVR
uniref:hypothetical protein n=1 Tax=Mariniflexile sp. TaxID=1979402 RepID=UPI004047CCB9